MQTRCTYAPTFPNPKTYDYELKISLNIIYYKKIAKIPDYVVLLAKRYFNINTITLWLSSLRPKNVIIFEFWLLNCFIMKRQLI